MSRVFVKPKRCIGPSQLSSILGYSDRLCTSKQLKENLENGFWKETTERMAFGIRNEAVGITVYEKHKQLKVTPAGFKNALNGRLVGKADGLIGEDGGLEIKCHMDREPLQKIPCYYLVQIVAYLYMYKREWWDFMSCSFRDGKIKRCKIIRIYWKNHRETWFREWLPQIKSFISSVRWKLPANNFQKN